MLRRQRSRRLRRKLQQLIDLRRLNSKMDLSLRQQRLLRSQPLQYQLHHQLVGRPLLRGQDLVVIAQARVLVPQQEAQQLLLLKLLLASHQPHPLHLQVEAHRPLRLILLLGAIQVQGHVAHQRDRPRPDHKRRQRHLMRPAHLHRCPVKEVRRQGLLLLAVVVVGPEALPLRHRSQLLPQQLQVRNRWRSSS